MINDYNDIIDYVPDTEIKEQSILYMWEHIFEQQYYYNTTKIFNNHEKILKIIKYQYVWARHPFCAFWYAVKVLHNRFPEGEPIIYSNQYFKEQYKRFLSDHPVHVPYTHLKYE